MYNALDLLEKVPDRAEIAAAYDLKAELRRNSRILMDSQSRRIWLPSL